MQLPNKLKKFSSIVEAICRHVDLQRFYINIYELAHSPYTVLEVKPFDCSRYPIIVFQLHWMRGLEYMIELPDYVCRPEPIGCGPTFTY